MSQALEPYYKPGETFDYNGITIESIDSPDHSCDGCVFNNNCLDTFDIHGICAASDIGRKNSIKFVIKC
jgi:hypothetical protein